MTPPLPSHRYLPGRTARHPEDAFDAIKARAIRPTATTTAAQNEAWRYGLRLFDARFWWEAHEVLEAVWLNAPPNSAERAQVQAVIQLANAALKAELGKPNAAARLLALARDLIAEAALGCEAVMGLSLTRLQEVAAAIEAGAPKPMIAPDADT